MRRVRLLAGLALALTLLLTPAAVAGEKPPRLDARAWLLVDARDGERLAAGSPARPLPIASATKLMTTYLALRDLELGRMVAAPPYEAAPAESVLGLREDEEVSVRDLVVAMMLPSANDAAAAVATEVSGSIPRFVQRMNGAARKLGLGDTSFANPIGLDDPLNVASARDLATLTLELRGDERFRRIVAKPDATLRSGAVNRRVSTRNTLLLADPSVDGVKTGHTQGAGYVLVASAERRGVPLVSVVLGAPSESARDAETAKLLDYGFSLYEPRRALRRREPVGEVSVEGGDPLQLEAERGFAVTAREDQGLGVELNAPESVEGPIASGERVGRVAITLDGERVGSVPAVSGRAVAAPGPLATVGGPLAAGLVVGGSMLLVVAVFTGARRKRSSPPPPERTRAQRTESHRRRVRRRTGEGEDT